ncbi:hypothetical protein [Roseateles chitinivorans]|uniref:hypothetical protein n=1 Tax=Roseateles chitinivorans TaxID=2917965 RepID=UPI003D67E24D
MRFGLFGSSSTRSSAAIPSTCPTTDSQPGIAAGTPQPAEGADETDLAGQAGRRRPPGRLQPGVLMAADHPATDAAIPTAIDAATDRARIEAEQAHARVLTAIDRQSADAAVLSRADQDWETLNRRRFAVGDRIDASKAATLIETRRQLDIDFARHCGLIQAHREAAQVVAKAATQATQAHRALADATLAAIDKGTDSRHIHAALAGHAGMAEHMASQARRRRDELQSAADTALQALDDAVCALADRCHAMSSLDAGTGIPGDDESSAASTSASARRGGLGEVLRRPLDGLRERLAPVKVDAAVGPFAVSSTVKAPTSTPDVEATARRPTTAASPRGLQAIDGKARTAGGRVAALLTQGASKRSSHDAPPVRAPAAFGSAVAFSAEVDRLFAPLPSIGERPGSRLRTGTDAACLAQVLLDHSKREVDGRPDGHPLRHEQALLIASTLRTVTADPARALQVHEFLRHDLPPALAGLSTSTAAGGKAAERAARHDPAIERMANAARRTLAATAGGFQTLLDLQGIALPAPVLGPEARRYAEQSFEHYKLGLRAEEALLTLGMKVRGRQSTTDIRNALEDHPDSARLLDPSRLGTGNARHRPGGPREAEHPATLAAQAFLYATENLDRPFRAAEARPDMKPAYVALRNGFTESGQGSDFHLMAKRLRKFVIYIDLACKTPEGRSPTALDRLRAPVRAVRRLMGKDKSPLRTLLQAGPMGADLGPVARVGMTADTVKAGTAVSWIAKLEADPAGGPFTSDEERRSLLADFDRATPARRRDILRRVMLPIVAGNDSSSYSDGRKYGLGGTFGYGVASVGGLGGMTAGVTPVGEFNLDHSRAAVFRTGVAPTTGLIFLGNERKVTGSIGAGVRVGAQAGPVVNLTAQAMARLGGSHLVSKGLMIRTKRDATLATKSAEAAGAASAFWNPASADVVNAIFEIADQPAAQRPAHGGAMWTQMVDRIGDLSTVSFGWNAAKTRTADVSVSLEGTAAARLGPGVGVSLVAGVGLKHTLLNKSESRDAAGALRSVQAGSGSRTALGAGVSLGISHPTLPVPGGPKVALFGRHKVGVDTELVIQSTNGMVRITTEDGKVHPRLSFKHREFGVRDDFIKVLNTQRDAWSARLGKRGPDGRLRDGDRMLDDFLTRLVNLPPGGNRVFIERKCLTAEAAETINACMDRLAVLQRPLPPGMPPDAGAQEQVTILQRQIAATAADESSWQPFKLVVNETVQRVKERGLGADVRATPGTGEDDFADRFLGGGRVTLGGHVDTALGGRDLLTMDALPATV